MHGNDKSVRRKRRNGARPHEAGEHASGRKFSYKRWNSATIASLCVSNVHRQVHGERTPPFERLLSWASGRSCCGCTDPSCSIAHTAPRSAHRPSMQVRPRSLRSEQQDLLLLAKLFSFAFFPKKCTRRRALDQSEDRTRDLFRVKETY